MTLLDNVNEAQYKIGSIESILMEKVKQKKDVKFDDELIFDISDLRNCRLQLKMVKNIILKLKQKYGSLME